MVDRTKEFLRLTSEAMVAAPIKKPAPAPSTPGSAPNGHPLDKRERTRQAIWFNEKASEVSKGIQACSVLLARLTTLARAQTLFNDPQDEMSLLSIQVKTEISQMKTKLAELDDWLKKTDIGGGRDAKQHSEQILKNMEFKLQDSGKQFVRVLESRKTALRAQTQRKRMFGDDDDEDGIGRPMPQSAFMVHDQEESSESNGSNMMTTTSMMPFQQQRQLIPDQQFLRSRVDAISTVESHIAELGQVMNTLAVMIHEQDALVHDIEENVSNSEMNVRAGFLQLEKYYHALRGNKQLMSRLFGVVVMFLLFFLIFLA
jgi:syntaxin 5